MIKGIYGINIAVRDLPDATARYERLLGIKSAPVGPGGFAFPGLFGSAFVLNGFHLNLIASSDPSTSVTRFLERKGEGVFLVSLEVDDMGRELDTMLAQGLEPLLKPSAKGDFGVVNFIHPKQMNGVQLELLQPGSTKAVAE